MNENDLEAHHCGDCGIRFAAPKSWWETRQEDGKSFYCPNGHQRVFRESTADRLRRERDRLAQQVAQRDDEIRRQRELREAAERQASAARGQVTKLKKRASAGVCPCCNRTFSALSSHMKQKHPEFVAENVVALRAPATRTGR